MLCHLNIVQNLLYASTCFFKEQFGMYCPGCGGSRAFLYILQLRFRESFLANPLVIILIIETIVLSIIYIYDVIIHKSKYIFYSITKKTFICTLIFGLIFLY